MKKIASLMLLMLGLMITNIIFAQEYIVDSINVLVINTVEWSPDGNYIATGHDGGVILWDGDSGALVKRISVHTQLFDSKPDVMDLSWSPDSSLLALKLGNPDLIVLQVIDVTTNNVISEFSKGYLQGMDWNPTGNQIVANFIKNFGEHTTTYVADPFTGQILREFSPFKSLDYVGRRNISEIKWLHLSNQFLVSYASNNAEAGFALIDANTGEIVLDIPHTNGIRTFDINPQEDKIVFNDSDRQAFILNITTGELVLYLTSAYSFDSVSDIDWNPISDFLAIDLTSSDSSRGVLILNAQDGSFVYEYSVLSGSARWSPDGSRVLAIQNRAPLLFTPEGEITPQIPLIIAMALVDDTGEPFEFLSDQSTLDLSQLTAYTQVGISAFTNIENVQQVKFALNGSETLDHEEPFTIDLPPIGEYSLTATPYIQRNGELIEGTPLTVNFSVE